jgi:cytochrome c-type biogenesis protein CcmH
MRHLRARSRTAAALTMLAAVLALATAGPVLAIQRTSFIQAEQDFMCVVCHEPLNVAQSPESFQERDVVRQLVLAGDTQQQIERAMVADYGPAVLAKPPAHGFNLLVYVIPPLVLVLGLITVAITLPRWRRRTRQTASEQTSAPQPELSPDEARRLDDDLARTV